MNSLLVLILKTTRKAVIKIFGNKVVRRSLSDNNPETASLIIYNVLIANNACMIARLGSTELSCLKNYLGVINNKGKYWSYVKGVASPWWWDQKVINQMKQWSGFFPAEQRKIEQFCNPMTYDEAAAMEVEIGIDLRSAGFGVWPFQNCFAGQLLPRSSYMWLCNLRSEVQMHRMVFHRNTMR